MVTLYESSFTPLACDEKRAPHFAAFRGLPRRRGFGRPRCSSIAVQSFSSGIGAGRSARVVVPHGGVAAGLRPLLPSAPCLRPRTPASLGDGAALSSHGQ